MITTNRTVDLIVKYSEQKTYFYNKVKGYSITEGKIHFRNPVNNELLHIPEQWVAIVDVRE
jgi:hypothetical protein